MSDDPILGGQQVSKGARRDDEQKDELNSSDGFLGIDLSDEECPDCGREIRRKMFSYKAYCPVCDTLVGRIKQFLGLIDDE